jgi:hypothetical protein
MGQAAELGPKGGGGEEGAERGFGVGCGVM